LQTLKVPLCVIEKAALSTTPDTEGGSYLQTKKQY